MRRVLASYFELDAELSGGDMYSRARGDATRLGQVDLAVREQVWRWVSPGY